MAEPQRKRSKNKIKKKEVIIMAFAPKVTNKQILLNAQEKMMSSSSSQLIKKHLLADDVIKNMREMQNNLPSWMREK